MSRFYLKGGELTAYALACGYVQEYKQTEESTEILKLACESPSTPCYSIVYVNGSNYTPKEWNFVQFYGTLRAARKAFEFAKYLINC